MSLTIQVLTNEGDRLLFDDYLKLVGNRMARQNLVPLLLKALDPLVAREKAILDPHSKSGALAGSLQARAGSGDRPGTISVFSAASGKMSLLKKTWGGPNARGQQRRSFAALRTKGRKKISYAVPLHQGHKVMVRGPGGTYVQSKTRPMTDPVPFAAQAVEALGDAAQEQAADAVLEKIING